MASCLFLATFLVSALLPTTCGFQDISKDVLPSPQVFSVNTNTVLVICRANVSGPFSSLQVKGNSSHKYWQDVKKSYLTSYDSKTPLVTSRLLLEQYETKFRPTLAIQHRPTLQQAQFLCHDSYSGRRSKVTKVTVESELKKTNSVSGISSRRNRKRKAFVNKTVKFIWHYSNLYEEENSPSPCHKCVRCYHDGNLLEQSKVIIKKSKVIVRLKNVTVHDTGFYWSEIKDSGNLTLISSFMQLRVIPNKKWSPWFVWIRCSAKCGHGSKVEARKCLHEQQQCDGPRIRIVPCSVPCTTTKPLKYSTLVDRRAISTALTRVLTMPVVRAENQPSTTSEPRHYVSTFSIVMGSTIAFLLIVVTAVAIIKRRYKKSASDAPVTCGYSEGTYRETTSVPGKNTASRPSYPALSSMEDLHQIKMREQEHLNYSRFPDFQMSNKPHETKCRDELVPKRNMAKEDFTVQLYNNCSIYDSEEIDLSVSSKVDCLVSHQSGLSTSDTSLYSNASVDIHSDPYSNDGTFDDSSPLNRQNSSKSQQSNSSNFSSISEKLCPKPTLPDTINSKLCAWGRFSEKGGRLTIQDTGVSLYVPKMAIPEGTSQLIYIGLMNRKGLYPELDEGHAVLSPAVICGPDGLKFDKPVHITVPHNAVIDDGSSWAPQVHSCPKVPQKQDDVAEWKSMEDAENNEPPFVHMDKTSMQIMVNHFTGFVVVGQPTELRIWVVSFCTEPKVDLDCTVRVYCIPATKAALEELRVDETTLKGTEKDARKPLKIYNNRKDIVVRVVNVREGWDADEDNQSIPFEDVWQMSQSPTCFPNASFMFARNKDDQFSFSSGFIVKQDMDNATTVKLKVSTSIKRLTSESSGYSSFSPENGGRTDIEYKIPLERRRTLCYLLDVERTDFRDYRLFAEKLGLEKNFINWLKRTACTSPTDEIIELWENTKSDKIPVTKLIDVLNEMERDDAAEELKNI